MNHFNLCDAILVKIDKNLYCIPLDYLKSFLNFVVIFNI